MVMWVTGAEETCNDGEATKKSKIAQRELSDLEDGEQVFMLAAKHKIPRLTIHSSTDRQRGLPRGNLPIPLGLHTQRRGWDLNPRWISPHALSRRAH
jgi:hypothetical protein